MGIFKDSIARSAGHPMLSIKFWIEANIPSLIPLSSIHGSQEIYIYAIDVASHQPNTFIGSRKVTIGEEEHIHNYTSKIVKAATCSSEGEKEYTCAQ